MLDLRYLSCHYPVSHFVLAAVIRLSGSLLTTVITLLVSSITIGR